MRVIIKEAVFNTIKTSIWGNSLVVQWLIFQAPNAGGLGSIPSQETRSHISQRRSKILHAATKTQLCCCCSAAQLCPTLCDPMDCSLPGSSVHPWDFPSKSTGVGCHFLLQGIFLTQGSNLGLLHCRQMLYHLSHHGVRMGEDNSK